MVARLQSRRQTRAEAAVNGAPGHAHFHPNQTRRTRLRAGGDQNFAVRVELVMCWKIMSPICTLLTGLLLAPLAALRAAKPLQGAVGQGRALPQRLPVAGRQRPRVVFPPRLRDLSHLQSRAAARGEKCRALVAAESHAMRHALTSLAPLLSLHAAGAAELTLTSPRDFQVVQRATPGKERRKSRRRRRDASPAVTARTGRSRTARSPAREEKPAASCRRSATRSCKSSTCPRQAS